MAVRDRDKGLKALLNRVLASKNGGITVGVHAAEGGAAEPGGATVADVATWNHFGTSRIPPRPFLTNWFDANIQEVSTRLKAAGAAIVKGDDPYKALQRVALWAEGGVKRYIAEGVPPDNADSTVAKKGSSKPLIDTGQLRSSIRGKVA
jgi:hypothetical protein